MTAVSSRKSYRRGSPTSLDELRWEAPLLKGLLEAACFTRGEAAFDHRGPPGLAASRTNRWPGQLCQRHLDGATSELVVSAGHLCQDHPEVIREVRRVLREALGR